MTIQTNHSSDTLTPTTGTLNVTGTLKMDSGYGSTAVAYGCRAWVNFNGTGTVAIRASGNVSSITDNGVGDYTVNFTTAMTDANYAWTAASGNDSVNGTVWVTAPPNVARTTWKQTGLLRVGVSYANTLLADAADVNVSVFR